MELSVSDDDLEALSRPPPPPRRARGRPPKRQTPSELVPQDDVLAVPQNTPLVLGPEQTLVRPLGNEFEKSVLEEALSIKENSEEFNIGKELSSKFFTPRPVVGTRAMSRLLKLTERTLRRKRVVHAAAALAAMICFVWSMVSAIIVKVTD